MNSPHPPPEPINPFEPMSVSELIGATKTITTFDATYWIVFAALFLLALLTLFFSLSFGIFASVTLFFVLMRTWMWSHRVREAERMGRALPAAIPGMHFLSVSLGFSFLATLASSVAFVSVCFPISLLLVSVSLNGTNGQRFNLTSDLILGLSVVCFCFAIWLALIIVRQTLPKLPDRSLEPIGSKDVRAVDSAGNER